MQLSKNRRVDTSFRGCVVGAALLAVSVAGDAAAQSVNFEQIRNGSKSSLVVPVAQWANGNANATQAHFREGHSTSYRAIITGLTAGNSYWMDISYDTKVGGKNAFDFITHYDRLLPHTGFAHCCKETLDPLAGLPAMAGATASTFAIPAPANGNDPDAPSQPTDEFNSLPAGERLATIFNGSFTDVSYTQQQTLANDDATSIIRFSFTASASNVVIAFGGHIASQETWGTGNSASSISGSPYHVSLASCSFGCNGQTLQLMASAVISTPPICLIDGPEAVCPGSTDSVFTGPAAPEGETYEYEWTLLSDCGATFGNGETTASTQQVTVNACDTCETFQIQLETFSDSLSQLCTKSVKTQVNTAIDILSCPPAPGPINCGESLPAPYATVEDFIAAGGEISDTCGPLTIESVTAEVPNCGTVVRTYTINDACGGTDTCEQVFTIVDNVPPVLSGCPTSVVNIQCASQIPALAVVTATDACTGNIGTITPTVQDVGIGCASSPRVITRTWTATDGCGNSASCTQTITIRDTVAPVLSGCPTGGNADISVQCLSQVPTPPTVTANDNCAGAITPVFNESSNGGTGCAGNARIITRTWTATDSCGNQSQCSQTITVEDTQPPTVFGQCPVAVINVSCLEDVPPASSVSAQDNCSTATVTVEDITNGGSGCEGDVLVIIRNYRATDGCGNSAIICSQTITVEDDSEPEVSCPPDINVECGDEIPDAATTLEEFLEQGGTVEDNCGVVSIEWLGDVQTSEGAECPITWERTYEITDACGNETECTQIIQLIDTSPPVMCCVVPEVIGCVGFPIVVQTPVVTDECGMTITPVATRSDDLSLSDPFPLGATTVTWSATDECGNAGEEIVVTVIMNDCPTYRSKTQDGWAKAANSLINNLFTEQSGGSVVVGKTNAPARSVTINADAALCVKTRLPASGAVQALPANFGNQTLDAGSCNTGTPLPLNGDDHFQNTLLGNAISLALSIRFDEKNCDGALGELELCSVMTTIRSTGNVKSYVIPQAVLTAMGNDRTVNGLLELANRALAGRSITPATRPAINNAITRVNTMFNHAQCVALLSTSCPQAMQAMASTDSGDSTSVASRITGIDLFDTSNGLAPNERDSDNKNTFVNNAVIAPALTEGVITVDGDFTQTTEGTTVVLLRGGEGDDRCDVVDVHGDAFLHGGLVVDVADNFMPNVGDEFHVIVADAIAGEFSRVTLAELEGEVMLDVRYLPTAVVVDVKSKQYPSGDLDRNGNVDVGDLLMMLRDFGKPDSAADITGDGVVDAADLSRLLSNWGPHSTR